MKKAICILFLAAMMMACGNHQTASLQLSADLMAKLAAADKADGKEDKLVAKCASCALAMDGKPEFEFELAEYKMHFCSDVCKKSYANDPEGRLASLKVSN